jgi:hypothetical protein
MFYFGPWDQPGHFFFSEGGYSSSREAESVIPWKDYEVDGVLQPGCVLERDRWVRKGPENEGEALLHHKGGWTALSFWDRSVDKRGACNSTYFAEGTFTFAEMVEMAKARFAVRWNKMRFEVKLKA